MVRMMFQVCWNCDFNTWSNKTLCKSCTDQFNFEIQFNNQQSWQVESFPLYYLFDITQSHIGNRWIYSLKGGGCHKQNYNFAANLLHHKILNHCTFDLHNAVIITPPSPHSEYLSESLAQKLNVNFFNGLKKSNPLEKAPFKKSLLNLFRFNSKALIEEQKYKSKLNRMSLEYVWDGPSINEKNVIFVDDVVTTGSTAVAAWIATGKPKSYFVTSLAYTSKLRR